MPHEKPKNEKELLLEIWRTLGNIWQSIGQTNETLRKTETNNERRHKELLAALRPVEATNVGFTFGAPELKSPLTAETKEDIMPETSITNEQKVSVTLKITTDTGKPAAVEGAPAWVVLSGNSALVVADDGLSAVVTSSDDPGDTSVIVKADANLGEGVEEISDTFTVHVIGATAKNLGVGFGTPEPK